MVTDREDELSDPFDIPLADMGQFTRATYAFWLDLKSDRPAPAKADFDIVVFGRRYPKIVPHLWLLQVERDPYRFRERVKGGAIEVGGALPGARRDVGALDPQGHAFARLVAGCEAIRPSFRRGPPRFPHARAVSEVENVFLPLLGPSGLVDFFLNCSVFHWQEGYGPHGLRVEHGPRGRRG